MNSTLLGGGAREGLREAYLKLDKDDINLCAKDPGCVPWRDTEAGRRRAERIKKKLEEAKA